MRFHAVALLHADEMDFKLGEGAEALIARLEDAPGVPETVRPDRPSVAPPRKRRGFFRRR